MAIVLLVDDDVLLRSTLAEALQYLGCSVREAGHGLEALVVIAHEPVDLILTDLQMPHMDGQALVAEIRSRGLEQPVAVMSGNGHATITPNFAGALEAGATVCLEKPLTLGTLAAALAPLLGSSGAASEWMM